MKRLLSVLLAFAILGMQMPQHASAAGTISAKQMIAGIGGVVELSGFPLNTGGSVTVHSPAGETFALPVNFDARGYAKIALPGERMTVAGGYVLSVLLGTTVDATQLLQVLPDSVDASRSSISADRKSFNPDGKDSAVITVYLQDKFGNPLSSRPVEFIASRSDAVLSKQSNLTDAQGMMKAMLTTKKAGAVTVRAFDLLAAKTLDATVTLMAIDPMYAQAMGGMNDDGTTAGMAPQQPYAPYPVPYAPYPYQTYNPYANPYAANLFFDPAYAQGVGPIVAGFQMTLSPSPAKTGDALNFTIRAVDRQGNIVRDFTGDVVVFSPTDGTATMPGSNLTETGEGKVTFLPRDQGEVRQALSVVFRRGGENILRAEDRRGAQPISSEITVNVTGPTIIPDANLIKVSYPVKNSAVNSANITVTGTGPKFSNLQVKIIGGAQDAFSGESDANGNFSIPVQLNPSLTSFVLRVQSVPNAKFDSGDIPFTLKANAPKIENILFSPEKPQEGENTLVTLLTEPKAKVQMAFASQDLTLVESSGKPGSYQVAFTAPGTGKYQPIITVTDFAGNTLQQRTEFEVRPKGMATVLNVKAEARPSSVMLSWSELPDAASYRVYVGKTPDDFLAIDTRQPTTSALITDLEPGVLYYFAVTGINGERESAEKSQIVTATPLGLKLKVTPKVEALQLQWQFPTDAPLSAYVLEYGVDAKKLSERRLINGELRDMTLRDLLPGVTYYVRITPITIEGTTLNDLSATGEGKVLAFDGYHPSAGEDPNFDPATLPPPDFHSGAPIVSGETGLPTGWVMAGVLAAILGTFYILRRKSAASTAQFLAAMEHQYRS